MLTKFQVLLEPFVAILAAHGWCQEQMSVHVARPPSQLHSDASISSWDALYCASHQVGFGYMLPPSIISRMPLSSYNWCMPYYQAGFWQYCHQAWCLGRELQGLNQSILYGKIMGRPIYAIEIEALDVVYSISTYVQRTVSISTYSQIFMHNKGETNVYRSRESGCICTRSHVLISTSSLTCLKTQKQNMNVFPCKSVCIQLI